MKHPAIQMMYTAACLLLSVPAIAQSERMDDPEGYWGVEMTEDATRTAFEWSRTNEGIAIAVLLGTESRVLPSQIEETLRREASAAGVCRLTFFYEQNDVPGTGTAYAYGGDVDGPFNLAEARDEIRASARQYLYQQRLRGRDTSNLC
mgnify:CR=1 FL=1